MEILWILVAAALVIGLIKTSAKLLKFLFGACLFIGAALFILTTLGIL